MLQGFLKTKNTDQPEVSDTRGADDAAFLEECKAQLDVLETFRQAKFKIYQFRRKIGIPAAMILTPALGYVDYLLLWMQRGNDDRGAGLTALFLTILYRWVTQPKRDYAKEYKQKMLPGIAKLFGNFYYDLKGQIPVHTMTPSKIVPKHDRCESEDYFTGTYKGVGIEFCEVKFQQKRKTKNSTRYVTVFKGLAVLLDMKTKRFYGHTILDKDKGKIASWFKEKSSNLKTANLVDPEFEKYFDVYTNDQVEARYLIDPVMIERITGLQTEYEGKTITAAFYENKMLVLIQSSHNHFEPADIAIPATDPRSVLGMKREIGEILSLIDRLDLYDPKAVHEQAAQGAGAAA
jgi:Protein of unknown function (DUF3137)